MERTGDSAGVPRAQAPRVRLDMGSGPEGPRRLAGAVHLEGEGSVGVGRGRIGLRPLAPAGRQVLVGPFRGKSCSPDSHVCCFMIARQPGGRSLPSRSAPGAVPGGLHGERAQGVQPSGQGSPGPKRAATCPGCSPEAAVKFHHGP